MNSYVIVFAGSGVGGALRYAVNVSLPKLLGTAFPYHTLAVNVIGSFAMGLLAGYFAFRGESPQSLKLFLMTGILGGFTTFSAFSLDTALLYERGELITMTTYALSSVLISVAALFAGLLLMRTFA